MKSSEAMPVSDYVIALTTLPVDGDADRFARTLVDERLAACVNILPEMTSIYRWQGSVEHERERQVVIKTSRSRVAQLWERMRALHPYDVPEFLVLSVIDGNSVYLRWVAESTTQG